MTRSRLYTAGTLLIIAGVVMLCQPFSLAVHSFAFPVFLAGVLVYVVLDHMPDFRGR